MNPKIHNELENLDKSIDKLVIETVARCTAHAQSLGDSVDTLGGIVRVMESAHQGSIFAAIGTILEMEEEKKSGMPMQFLRSLVDECVADFEGPLRKQLLEHYPQVFDGNAKLREELLGEIDAD